MKKFLNSVLSISLCTLLLFGTIAVGGSGFAEVLEAFTLKASAENIESGTCGKNITYTLDKDTGVLTISGTGKMYKYDYDTSPFYNNTSIKSVIIEKGISNISAYLFYDCTGLESVTIPNSVKKIDYSAFCNCSCLKSVTIPDSVTSIDQYAFAYCAELKNIVIPNSVTIINYGTFYSCIGLESVTIPNSVIEIQSYAFYNCTGLKSVTIPNSVTAIGYCAFENCAGLENISISNSVTSIEESAFYDCTALKSITIPNSVTSIADLAFYNCTGLKNIVIPDSVTYIGYSAFGNTEYFNDKNNWDNGVLYIGNHLISADPYSISGSYSVKNGIISLAEYAFYNCTGLTNITIPNSVKGIGDGIFYNCTGLESIIIPASVVNIGKGLSAGCTGLKSIKIDSENTVYDSRDNCNAIIDTDSNTLLAGCKNTIIPNSVTAIGPSAFESCTGLESIAIPTSVTTIDAYAFYGCSGLKNITIPNSVTTINEYAFEYCTNIKSVTIPTSVTQINYGTFSNCTGLESITIPNSVTSIEGFAFSNCTGLKDISIPDSVTNIGWDVFENTGYYNDRNNWDSGVLYVGNCLVNVDTDNISGSYSIKNGTIAIAEYAFKDCTGLESISIPNSVKGIGFCAFEDCTGLKDITLPNSVTNIDNYAFDNCTGLKDITLPNSISNIGYNVFYNTEYYNDESNWDDGVLYIGNYLIEAKSNIIDSYSVKNGTTLITKDAFYECDGLISITIPNSVKNICDYAFYYNLDLTDVYYAGSEEDREKLNIEAGNELLENATWHYNSYFDPVVGLTEKDVINGNPTDNQKTYEYKSTITFTANVPEGGLVQWYINDVPAGTDASLTVSAAKKSYTVKVVVIDNNGNVSADTENVTIKTGFFDRILAFFKLLFNKNAFTFEQK